MLADAPYKFVNLSLMSLPPKFPCPPQKIVAGYMPASDNSNTTQDILCHSSNYENNELFTNGNTHTQQAVRIIKIYEPY